MSGKLAQLESDAAARIASCGTLAGIEKLRVQYLGRKGAITELLKSVSQLPAA
ncbi:MAG: phenylalanine--tRNA ligase subunit alpha, partial [Candidatus Edwardsbacteria bacterium]|nr:phenylalanine--tRNA ligase subunit alpha [Candidatus Edwardsbacteria bacterium]